MMRDDLPQGFSLAEQVRMIRSPGGVEAWLFEDHAIPVVSLAFAFVGGAGLDPVGKAGTARLLGGLLTQGAGDLSGKAFRARMADHAIRLGFGIVRDRLVGQMFTLAKHRDEAFKLLAAALQAPLFEPSELEQRRALFRGQLRAAQGSPDTLAGDVFWATAYRDHPYGRSTAGTLDDVEAIAREDLIALQRVLVTRCRARIVVVGAISEADAAAAIDAIFAPLPNGGAQPIAQPDFDGVGRTVMAHLDTPHASIVFGRPALSKDDPDYPAAAIVNHCLGGGTTSRLYRELRHMRGLCYSVQTWTEHLRDAHLLVGMTSTANAHVEELMGIIQGEMQRMAASGPGEDETRRAARYLIGADALGMETLSAIGQFLLSLRVEGQPIQSADRYRERLAAVTTADTRRAAGRLLDDGGLLFSVVNGTTAEHPSAIS
ncbi:pitrilysin family protein [Sphingomonas sp. GM_Shp_2]|uniref:M16 family metallopeptidase n=1 Tax=Sphingomonas sp. GM_Shp_2 TaxID=2937380 RepID=UPI002269A9A6|nr:pitrilysin family protein [Sphingomonas sp. GM_Shp_2]